MNYIGSKTRLIKQIASVLSDYGVPQTGIALDLFAGTAVASKFFKSLGYQTYTNDWQAYSAITAKAVIGLNTMPTFGGQGGEVVLASLNALPGREGVFFNTYCEGGRAGRLYFSKANGQKIQTIRDQIAEWFHTSTISQAEYDWLVACLIKAADQVANTASVYGAYLKVVKASAQKSLILKPLDPIPSPDPSLQHHVFSEDAETLLNMLDHEKITLTYLDPPYNHRQYAANYHILETLAQWDLGRFEPRGVAGLRPKQEQCSRYCKKSKVVKAFQSLFERLRSDYVLFSYNNEGLLSESDLMSLFDRFCSHVQLTKIRHNRFRADKTSETRMYKGDYTEEFLLIGSRY